MNASDGRLKAAGEPYRVHAECGVCSLPSGLPGPMRGEPTMSSEAGRPKSGVFELRASGASCRISAPQNALNDERSASGP